MHGATIATLALVLIATASVSSLFLLSGCNRPAEEKCTAAVKNMLALTRNDGESSGFDEATLIRSCRANAKLDAVECYIAARNAVDMKKCEGPLSEKLEKKIADEEKEREGKAAKAEKAKQEQAAEDGN